MRALLCRELTGWRDLVLEEVPEPQPGEGQVLIEVAAAGLNFPDLLMLEGRYQMKPALPFVPGGECAGVVAAVGPGVRRRQVGERVAAMALTGGCAEKIVVPEASTLPLPPRVDLATAAGVPIVYGTSFHALRERARLAAGETVLVLGAAGGVGLAAVELARWMGARVIAAASSEEKLQVAREAGAELCIDYSREPLKEKVKELTGGRGADVVYDPVGGELSEAALRAIAWNGRFLVVGFASGDIPRLPLNLALLKGASLVGVFWGSWMEREPAAAAAAFTELLGAMAKGELRPRITRLPLERFAEGFARLAERRAVGKIVLEMG